jgi:16S rRNA (cytosine967-C5)-methyltransferase
MLRARVRAAQRGSVGPGVAAVNRPVTPVVDVQQHATLAVLEVLGGRSLSAVLASVWARYPALKSAERAAIQDLCFGTCRWLGTLKEVLRLLLRKPMGDADVEALVLTSLYQLEWTRAPAYAVVDGAVRTCARLGKASAKGLVNAVLRRFLREREILLHEARATPAGRFSYPAWWVKEVQQAYPDRFEAILDAGNRHPPMTLRVNRRRTSVEAYLQALQAAGMPGEQIGPFAIMLERPVPVDVLPGFADGLISVQDLSAQRAAGLLRLSDGLRVLDACAAPGGKTAHLLEMADVRLTAIDNDSRRLERLRETLERLRLDARVLMADAADLAAWWDGEPFDRVLLDAPCSASGIVRRHPDIKWLRHPDDLERLERQQTRLLRALWRTVAPGGTLLYATCSLFPAENQARIADFLHAHKNAQRLPITELARTDGQLLPNSRQDGFFYALLHRLDGAQA